MVDWIKYTSIFFVIVPLLLSAISYKTFKLSPVLLGLLLVGFIADLFNLYYEEQSVIKRIVWDVYSIFECTILLWIIRYRKNALAFMDCLKILFLISIPLWVVCLFVYGSIEALAKVIEPLSLFIILYQVYVIFYSAKEVLWLGEQENRIIVLPMFWIFMGIFFYSIGTFFIMGFLSSPILLPMYYINNMVNIITHLFFLIGLCIHLLVSFNVIKSDTDR